MIDIKAIHPTRLNHETDAPYCAYDASEIRMRSFHIDVRLEDGSRRDRHDRIGSLGEACRAAFALAEELSASTAPADADVRWVDVVDRTRLEISIQIFPGEPMTRARSR